MPGPSPETCAWLVSDEGLARVSDAATRLEETDALATGKQLRASGLPPERAAAVSSVAAARLRARSRYPDAGRLLFTPDLLEQASHPAVSAWRAERFVGADVVVDLCTGAGSDAMALSAVAGVVAVDRDRCACVLARHNLAVRGGDTLVAAGDALAPPVASGRAVHVDPSRRDGTRRARRLAEYRPPVGELLRVLRGAPGAALVVSPAVDLGDPDLPRDGELEFVQVGDDLVEAVLWLGGLRDGDVTAAATLLDAGGDAVARLGRVGPPVDLPVGEIGDWLVEAAPSLVRARLHHRVGSDLGAWRVAERRALLSTDRRPAPSPLYRAWIVEAVLSPRARDIRGWLRGADELPLEIATHGMDVDPASLWSDLGSPPRGPSGRRLHLVRLDGGAVAVATRAT